MYLGIYCPLKIHWGIHSWRNYPGLGPMMHLLLLKQIVSSFGPQTMISRRISDLGSIFLWCLFSAVAIKTLQRQEVLLCVCSMVHSFSLLFPPSSHQEAGQRLEKSLTDGHGIQVQKKQVVNTCLIRFIQLQTWQMEAIWKLLEYPLPPWIFSTAVTEESIACQQQIKAAVVKAAMTRISTWLLEESAAAFFCLSPLASWQLWWILSDDLLLGLKLVEHDKCLE